MANTKAPGAARADTFDPVNNLLAGVALGQLIVGVLGVLVVTGEYSSGAIRSTLAAVPNRPLLLAAQAGVFGLVTLAVGEVITFFNVLALMAQGRSNAAIAQGLVVSAGTVEKHIAAVFAELGLPSSEDANRRVLAVLRYLGTRTPGRGTGFRQLRYWYGPVNNQRLGSAGPY
ncbi:LuxR C-terminal-related transcriptional regulator [Streptomyces canus]|nr:LuxR C-terminal-related transcriptional regulator [Streptomyces canus]